MREVGGARSISTDRPVLIQWDVEANARTHQGGVFDGLHAEPLHRAHIRSDRSAPELNGPTEVHIDLAEVVVHVPEVGGDVVRCRNLDFNDADRGVADFRVVVDRQVQLVTVAAVSVGAVGGQLRGSPQIIGEFAADLADAGL